MVNLEGIQYPIFIGIGAAVSTPICLLLALVAVFAPGVWPYVLAPMPLGAFIGFVVACFAK